jgi:hypothetical protein
MEVFAPFLVDFTGACAAAAARDDLAYWTQSESVYERALEAVVADLCGRVDRRTRGRFLLACAHLAYPVARERGYARAASWGFGLFDDNGCDPTALGQIERLETWLADPTPANLRAMAKAIDESRQLQMWDDDLRPKPGEGWPYLMEVTDLMLRAVTQDDAGLPARYSEHLPASWPAPTAARRAVVCAHKVLLGVEEDPEGPARTLVEAIREATSHLNPLREPEA